MIHRKKNKELDATPTSDMLGTTVRNPKIFIENGDFWKKIEITNGWVIFWESVFRNSQFWKITKLLTKKIDNFEFSTMSLQVDRQNFIFVRDIKMQTFKPIENTPSFTGWAKLDVQNVTWIWKEIEKNLKGSCSWDSFLVHIF